MADPLSEEDQLRLLANGYYAKSPWDVPEADEVQAPIEGAQILWDKFKGSTVGKALRGVGDWASDVWNHRQNPSMDALGDASPHAVAGYIRNWAQHPSQLGRDVVGAGDTAGSLAQNFAASVPAGLAGLAGSVVDRAQGNDDYPTAQRWQNATQGALGYQPVTPEGQANTSAVGQALRHVSEGPGNFLSNLGVPPMLLMALDDALALGPPGSPEAEAATRSFLVDAAKAGVPKEAAVAALHERSIIPHARMMREAGLDTEGPMQGPMTESASKVTPVEQGADWRRMREYWDKKRAEDGLEPLGPMGVESRDTSWNQLPEDQRQPWLQAKVREMHEAGWDPPDIVKLLQNDEGVPPGETISAWREHQNQMALDDATKGQFEGLGAKTLEEAKGPAPLREVGPPPNDFTPKQEKSAALRSADEYQEALKTASDEDANDLTNAGMWMTEAGAPPGFTPKKMGKLDQRILQLADLGKKGAPWYWNSRRIIERLTKSPEDASKLARVEASMSPQVPVDRAHDLSMNYLNRRNAIGPEETVARGDEFPHLKETLKSANRVMEGGEPGGPKRDSFGINLDPNSPWTGRTTNDSWMSQAYGYADKKLTDPQYNFITGHQNHVYQELLGGEVGRKYPELAAAIQEPMDLQAAVWVGKRLEQELKGKKWESLPAAEQKRLQDWAQQDYESVAEKTRMHVAHEGTPATKAQQAGHMTGFNELPYERKKAYEQLTEPERDPYADYIGAPAEPVKDSVGTWTDEGGTHHNPLLTTDVHGGMAKGGEGVDPHSMDAAQFVALNRAMEKAQEMVPVHKVETGLPKSRSATANALRAFEGPGSKEDVGQALDTFVQSHNQGKPFEQQLTIERTGDGSYTLSGAYGGMPGEEFRQATSPLAEALRRPQVENLPPPVDRFGTGRPEDVFRMPPSEPAKVLEGRRIALPGADLDLSDIGHGKVTDQFVGGLKPIKERSPGFFDEKRDWSPVAEHLRNRNAVETNPFGAFPKAHPAMTKWRELYAQMGPKRFVEWWDSLSPEAKRGSGLPVAAAALGGAELLKQLNQGGTNGD